MERVKEVIVLDASVVVKWFVKGEQYTTAALTLRQKYTDEEIDIACPQLLHFEVLNALRYNPEFGEEQVKSAGEALQKYQFQTYPILGELSERCIKNSYKFGLTIYDASYIALAEYLNAKLYTSDAKLIEKIDRSEHLVHIKDLR